MNEKRKITDEEKRQLAKLFKGLIPNDTLDEDDILWIMNEVENGNRDISFEDFMKAKQERHNKFAAKKSEDPHFCFRCKHQACKPDEDPCKNCSEWPHPGYSTMASKWEPKEETTDAHLCKYCKFVENPVFKEPCCSCFKWEDNGALYHKNWKPKVEDTHLCTDCKFAETPIFEEPCISCLKSEDKSKNWQPKMEKDDVVHKDPSMDFGPNMMGSINIKNNINDIFGIDGVKKKIDELSESLESINAKIDILDQRMHDLRQHQILKDTKCITQVKDVEKDILEKLNNIEQVVMKNSIGINTTYEKASAVHDEVCKDEDICKDCNYYGMCSGYEGDMIYCKNFKKKDISSAKEPPKFKVGDIVKVTNDSKNNDFFVCRIKWSERSKTWNYLISMDLEDISGAFWRTENWLTKSEDHSEPLFKVGDKVKLKAGTTVYTVLSVTHFMCGERKVYRYRISHSATTPHYENENRLIKA